jgi:signal transduction histidine kinase
MTAAAQPEQVTDMSSPFAARPSSDNACHLLLVESDPGQATLTRDLLARAEAQRLVISRAATLEAAMALLSRGEAVDGIILDLNLPDSQGVETVRRIKIVTREAPIIAITRYADSELRHRARIEGADDLFSEDESSGRLFWRSVLKIIDRKRSQQRQFQALLDASPDGVLLVNDAGVVRYVNAAAIDMFGRSREELFAEPIGFSVNDAKPIEITVTHPAGDRCCEMRVVRMEWDDEPTWLASIRDITERKRNEALLARSRELEFDNRRIEQANHLKSIFLANMSHELRTPLNAIIGFTQLIDDGVVPQGSPKHKVFIGHVLSSGRHLLQLINDVLDLAKVESGKVSFHPERVDLLQITEHVVEVLEVVAGKKGVDIAIEFDPSLDHIEVDPGRFKQVLYNYLSNAIKFSPDGGRVDVSLRAEGEHRFRVEVRDRGFGIAPSDVARLFHQFDQIEPATGQARTQGTGLGLALTKRLVELQGGWVGVSSLLGEGSEFFAVLPRIVRGHEPRR